MVLKTAVTLDMSKLIDPTIEMWLSVDDSKRKAKAPLDYWYAAKSFRNSEQFMVLESDIPTAPASSKKIDYFPLVFTRDFWRLQENAIYTGLEDSALMICRDFFEAQSKLSSIRPGNEETTDSSGDWKEVQYSSLKSNLSDRILLFYREFWQFQESQSLLGIDDIRLSFIKEFWQFQESQSLRGIDDTHLAFLRDFWRVNTLQVSRGLSDGAIVNCMKFLKKQGIISVTGLYDDVLTAFTDFWERVNRTIENDGIKGEGPLALKELLDKEMVLDEINNCIKLYNSTNTIMDDNSNTVIASLRKLRLDMLTTLQKKGVNLELISKEQQLSEISNLQKSIGHLLEKLDEVSQHIVQGLVHDKSKMYEVEPQCYQLLSKNAKFAFENQELVSNFVKSQKKLISCNASLRRVVFTMEKNTEKYLKKNYQMQNIIRKLNKRLSSTSTDCTLCSTRSKGSRRKNNFSKKRHVVTNFDMPSSLDLIYVDC